MSTVNDVLRMLHHERELRQLREISQQNRVELLFQQFTPVYEMLDVLHQNDVRLRGFDGTVRLIAAGQNLRQMSGAAPTICIPLNGNTRIVLSVRALVRQASSVGPTNFLFTADVCEGSKIEKQTFTSASDLVNFTVPLIMQHEITDPAMFTPSVVKVSRAPVQESIASEVGGLIRNHRMITFTEEQE